MSASKLHKEVQEAKAQAELLHAQLADILNHSTKVEDAFKKLEESNAKTMRVEDRLLTYTLKTIVHQTFKRTEDGWMKWCARYGDLISTVFEYRCDMEDGLVESFKKQSGTKILSSESGTVEDFKKEIERKTVEFLAEMFRYALMGEPEDDDEVKY